MENMKRRDFLVRSSLLASAGLMTRASLSAQAAAKSAAPAAERAPLPGAPTVTQFKALRRDVGIFTGRGTSRCTRAPCVPSLAWKVIPSSAATRLSKVAARSKSQKCRASAKRARNTRSLPAMIARPPSAAPMFATKA